MTMIALMTAVTCIVAPFAIPLPFSPVPISFTNFIILLNLYILGTRYATFSYLLYLLIGMVGMPVFSGFAGGFGKLAGPTGGYLIGFIFMLPAAGFFIDHFKDKKYMHVLGMILGTIICYIFGTGWLCIQAHMSFQAGLAAGVIPYVPGDLIKIVVVMAIGPVIAKAIHANQIKNADSVA